MLGMVGIVLAVIAVRVVVSSSQELDKADALRAKEDLPAAIVHYRRAARWYAPGNPYSRQALSSLGEMGRDAETQGDVPLALSCWRGIRGSILATRSFYTPETAKLRVANQRIADLMSGQPAPVIDAGKSREELRLAHLALLKATPRPALAWTLMLLFGFCIWVSALFLFAQHAFDEEDRWLKAPAIKWSGVTVVGLLLFFVGLLNA